MKSLLASTRTLLFVALSGVAVPACQHFEGGPSREAAKADLRRASPPVVLPDAQLPLTS